MTKCTRYTLASILVLWITGCYFKQFTDVSSDPKLSHFIGAKYIAHKELLVYGITLDENYRKVVDYYTVMEPPGIDGPEVVSRRVLPPGTSTKILRVERCSNCLPFMAELRWVVEVLSDPTLRDHPVVIDSGRIDLEKTGALIKTDAGTY